MLNGPQLECLRQTGRMLLIPRPSTGIPTTERRRYGWAWDENGYGYFEDAGAAVPATARLSRGIAFTPDGALYVTNSAPSASARFVDGFYVRADGALHVTSYFGNSGVSKSGLDRDAGRVKVDFLTPILPWVYELWTADQGLTYASEKVSAWAGLKAVATLAQGTDANKPLVLPYSGTNYLWLPGVAGNYASTPDAAPLDITANMSGVCFSAADDWTPSAAKPFMSKRDGANTWQYTFNTTGNPVFQWWDGAALKTATGTASVAGTDYVGLWTAFSIAFSGGNATVKFWKAAAQSTLPTSWEQVGDAVVVASNGIDSTAGNLRIGDDANGGLYAGKFYRAMLYSGDFQAGGTLAFDANFSAVSEGATSFTESSSNGATVTINSTGAKPAQIVGSQQLLFDGSAFYMDATFTLDQPFTRLSVFKPVTWTTGDRVLDGKTATTNLAQLSGAANDHWVNAGTGNIGPANLPTGSFYVLSEGYNGASSFIQKNLAAATVGNAGANNAGGLTVGSSAGGTNPANVQVKSLAVCNTAPSTARLSQIITALNLHSAVF